MDAAVFGMPLEPIDDELTPISAVVLVNCTDLESGDDYFIVRTTDGLTAHQCIGMLIDALDMTREETRENHE